MRLAALVLSGALIASTTIAGESDYNLGVNAYKKKDYAEAAAQWKKSVARGNADAMNNLGFLLYYGYGVTKDLEAAIGLWRAASFAGTSEAQWHLGNAYQTGVGVEKDAAKAYAWYRCAIETASTKIRSKAADSEGEADILEDAQESLQQLSETITAADRARGEALANAYIARYAKPAP